MPEIYIYCVLIFVFMVYIEKKKITIGYIHDRGLYWEKKNYPRIYLWPRISPSLRGPEVINISKGNFFFRNTHYIRDCFCCYWLLHTMLLMIEHVDIYVMCISKCRIYSFDRFSIYWSNKHTFLFARNL